jgi:hypothetical protein
MVEGAVDSSGEDSDGGYSRFEESSKWVAEMGEQLVEAESSVTSSEDFMKGALATLDMLDEKVERVDVRLGQIEIRMKGLEERGKEAEIMKKEDEPGKKRKVREESTHGIRRSERLRPKRAGGSQLGKGVLMQSILGMFMPHGVARKTDSGHHEVLQEVLRGVAVGLELAESMALGVELSRMRVIAQRKQKLYDLTSKVIEDALHKLVHENGTQAELREGLPNCTTTATDLGEFNAREGVAFGLQIMGVFT